MSNDSEVLNEYSAWRLALYEQPDVVDDSVQRFLAEREEKSLARRARAVLEYIVMAQGNEIFEGSERLEDIRRILEDEPVL